MVRRNRLFFTRSVYSSAEFSLTLISWPTILTAATDRPDAFISGHYVGSLRNRVALQNDYETFILLADVQAADR